MWLRLLLICGSNLLWNGTSDQFPTPDRLDTDQFGWTGIPHRVWTWNQKKPAILRSKHEDQSMSWKPSESELRTDLYFLYLQFTQSFLLQKGVTIKITMIEVSFIQNKSMLSSARVSFFPLTAQCDGSSETELKRIPDWELACAAGC